MLLKQELEHEGVTVVSKDHALADNGMSITSRRDNSAPHLGAPENTSTSSSTCLQGAGENENDADARRLQTRTAG